MDLLFITIFSILFAFLFYMIDLPLKNQVLTFMKYNLFISYFSSILSALLLVIIISLYNNLAPFWFGMLLGHLLVNSKFSHAENSFYVSLLFFLALFGLNPVNFILVSFFLVAYLFDTFFFEKIENLINKHYFKLSVEIMMKDRKTIFEILKEFNFIFLINVLIFSIFADFTIFIAFISFKIVFFLFDVVFKDNKMLSS